MWWVVILEVGVVYTGYCVQHISCTWRCSVWNYAWAIDLECMICFNIFIYCSKIHCGDRLGDIHAQFSSCHVFVDGTDFRIQEPTPFSHTWNSHKLLGPGVRYEIGMSFINHIIVWVDKPFSCGIGPDVQSFKERMCSSLSSDEWVTADLGYRHAKCITQDDVLPYARALHSQIRARHKTCNELFKRFSVLGQVFRHNVKLHSRVLHVVSKIVALAICYEESFFGFER